MNKRIFALLLALVMVISLIPMTAMAAEDAESYKRPHHHGKPNWEKPEEEDKVVDVEIPGRDPNTGTGEGAELIVPDDNKDEEKPEEIECKHEAGDIVNQVINEATCCKAGSIVETCKCGATFTTTINATGNHDKTNPECEQYEAPAECKHEAGDIVNQVINEATCCKAGSIVETCKCGATFTTTINATGNHDKTNPECEQYEAPAVCKHEAGDIVNQVINEATCCKAGSIVETCKCGATFTTTIDATGAHDKTNPECEQYEAPECEHNYQVLAEVTPDCTAGGSKVYVCLNCGDEYTENLPADPFNHNNPNCEHQCRRHRWTLMAEVTPDCQNTGSKQYCCSKCGGWKYVDLPVDPDTHNPITCDCFPQKPERPERPEKPSKPHRCWHNWTLMAEVTPDCQNGGEKQYWCNKCNEWKTVELDVDPTNHNPITCDCFPKAPEKPVRPGHGHDHHGKPNRCKHDWTLMAEVTPDCMNGGQQQYWCSKCNEWKTIELDPNPENHNPNCEHDKVVDVIVPDRDPNAGSEENYPELIVPDQDKEEEPESVPATPVTPAKPSNPCAVAIRNFLAMIAAIFG